MSKVYVFLADGFEEIEGLTVVDLLRRAGEDVVMVSIKEETEILGSHKIRLQADTTFEKVDFSDADLLVLPGGGVGTDNLKKFQPLHEVVTAFAEKGGKIAAICAAPTVFGMLGLLKEKKATCYPSMEDQLEAGKVSRESVVVDGNIITSRGLGTAIDFALELIAQLQDGKSAENVAKSVVYQAK